MILHLSNRTSSAVGFPGQPASHVVYPATSFWYPRMPKSLGYSQVEARNLQARCPLSRPLDRRGKIPSLLDHEPPVVAIQNT